MPQIAHFQVEKWKSSLPWEGGHSLPHPSPTPLGRGVDPGGGGGGAVAPPNENIGGQTYRFAPPNNFANLKKFKISNARIGWTYEKHCNSLQNH